MAKDIVISGSTFLGVEQINFTTPSGGKVSFVDADTRNPQAIICSVICKRNTLAFSLGAVAQTATPQSTISAILEV